MVSVVAVVETSRCGITEAVGVAVVLVVVVPEVAALPIEPRILKGLPEPLLHQAVDLQRTQRW